MNSFRIRTTAVIVGAILAAGLSTGLPAQEDTSAWELFAEPEQGGEGDLDLDFEEAVRPQPKYTLDQLVEPALSDPDVYIRFRPGRSEEAEEPAVEALRERPASREMPATRPETGAEARPPSAPSLALPPGTGSVVPLRAVKPDVPIVRTFEDYMNALDRKAPEIIFEGKRWVYYEAEGRYVLPQHFAVEEARRTQMGSMAAAPGVGAATELSVFDIPPDLMIEGEPPPWLTPDAPDFPITRATGQYRVRGLQQRSLPRRGEAPTEAGPSPVPRFPRGGYQLRGTRSRPSYATD